MKQEHPEKRNSKLLKFIFVTYSALLICQLLLKFVIQFNNYQANFEHWNFADWLINYEGGFVRRGILGQTILYLYNLFGINIGQTLHIISLLSTFALIALVITIFIKKRLSLFILPTVVMLGTFAINDITSFRRDQLMLLIIFLILYLYKKYTTSNYIIYYLLFCVTGVLVILIHEASFFCFVPFIFIHKCNCINVKNIFKSTIFLLPIIVTMGVCCIFKGDATTANAIWDSYQPYFINTYGESLPMSEAINALTWKTIPTASFHLKTNYQYPCYIGWFITFTTTFYLCANINRVNLFSYERKRANSVSLTNILILQFISLLPMFTVLSCDLGRITIYWTITSFFIYALFDKPINIPLLTNASTWCNNFFNLKILSSDSLYIFITATVACPLVNYIVVYAYNSTIIGNTHRFIELGYKLFQIHIL